MILKKQLDIEWAPQPNEMSLIISSEMPPAHLCTAAYVFAFDGEKILMADLNRGIDIPGGHIEPDESPEAAMRRETFEETGAIIGAARVFGHQKLILKGLKPDGYLYPYPESYQIMYFSIDFRLKKFAGDEDSKGAVLVTREQAKNVPWLQKNRAIYDYVFSLLNSDGGD